MSRTRAAAVGAALLIGLSGVATAQAPARPGHDGARPRAGMRREGEFGKRFGKDLNLTAAQQARIKAIHEKYKPQFEAYRTQMKTERDRISALRQKGDTAGARAEMQRARAASQQRMQTIRKQELAEVRAVLTAEQRAKFDAAQAQRKEKMEKRGPRGRRGPGGYRGQRS